MTLNYPWKIYYPPPFRELNIIPNPPHFKQNLTQTMKLLILQGGGGKKKLKLCTKPLGYYTQLPCGILQQTRVGQERGKSPCEQRTAIAAYCTQQSGNNNFVKYLPQQMWRNLQNLRLQLQSASRHVAVVNLRNPILQPISLYPRKDQC